MLRMKVQIIIRMQMTYFALDAVVLMKLWSSPFISSIVDKYKYHMFKYHNEKHIEDNIIWHKKF